MKTLYSFGFILLFVGFSQAQNDWVAGAVVLKDQQVLVGEISRKPIHELILFKSLNSIRALPSHQVAYYRYYDNLSNINRQFLSVKSGDLFGSSKFFEIVIQGSVKVVRRYHKKSTFEEIDEARDYDYFAFMDNNLVPLTKFKNKIFPSLQGKFPIDIPAFVSINKLSIQTMKSAFLIIKHYNAINKEAGMLAQID